MSKHDVDIEQRAEELADTFIAHAERYAYHAGYVTGGEILFSDEVDHTSGDGVTDLLDERFEAVLNHFSGFKLASGDKQIFRHIFGEGAHRAMDELLD